MIKLKGYETANILKKKISKKIENVEMIDNINNNYLTKSFYVKSIKFINTSLYDLLLKNKELFKKEYLSQISRPLSTNNNSIFKGDFFHLLENEKHINIIESKNYHGIPGQVKKLRNIYHNKNFSKTSESNYKTLNLINLFDLLYFKNKYININEKEKEEINELLLFLKDIEPNNIKSDENHIEIKNKMIAKDTFLFIFLLFEFGYAIFFWLKNNYTFNKIIINLNEKKLKISSIDIEKLLNIIKIGNIKYKIVVYKNYTYLQFFSNEKELYNVSLRNNKQANSTIIKNELLKNELLIEFKENEYKEFILDKKHIERFNEIIITKLFENKSYISIEEKKETKLDKVKNRNENNNLKITFPSMFKNNLLEIIEYYFLITKKDKFEFNELKKLYYEKNKKNFIDNFLKYFENEIELQNFILMRISQNINPMVTIFLEKNSFKKVIYSSKEKYIIKI